MAKKDILHKIGDSENDFFCGRKSLDEHKKLVSDSKKLIKNDKDFDEAISSYEYTIKKIEKGVDEFGQSYKEGIEFSKELENPKFKVGDIVKSVSNGKKYLISDICVCENVVGDYGRFRWSKCYVFKNENGGYLDSVSGHYVEDCLTADTGWYKKVENKTNMSIKDTLYNGGVLMF